MNDNKPSPDQPSSIDSPLDSSQDLPADNDTVAMLAVPGPGALAEVIGAPRVSPRVSPKASAIPKTSFKDSQEELVLESALQSTDDSPSDSTPQIDFSLDQSEGAATVALISPFHPTGPHQVEKEHRNIKDFAVAGILNYARNIAPHARRVFKGNLSTNLASMDERALLSHDVGITGASSQSYVTWRRSALVLMIVPLTVSLLLSTGETLLSVFGDNSFKGVLPGTEGYVIALKTARISSYIASLTLAMFALRFWSDYKKSRRLLAMSWGMSFAIPFLLALVPLRIFIDAIPMLPKELGLLYVARPELKAPLEMVAQSIMSTGVGLYVVITLVPVVLSLLPASIRGSLTLKMLIPESPLMGFVAVVAPVVFVLFGGIFFLMLHQLVGDIWLIASMFFLLCSPLVYVVRAKTLTRPMSGEEVYATLRVTKGFAGAFAAVGGVFFIIFIAESALMQALLEKTHLFTPLKASQWLIDYIAKYFLTTVVVSDLFLRILQGLRIRELTDPMRAEHSRQRESRLDQLLTMTESIHER